MPLLMRAVTYASLFIGLVLVFVPARLLSWAGVAQPSTFGALQIGAMALAAVGAGLALWCVGTFVRVGRGTPAPFDPPRRLVVAGPYRFVRNPMYLGAGLALAGAALFYTSWWLVGYLGLLFLASHLFIVFHEEPALGRSFGQEYREYCEAVGRWVPRLR